MRKTKRLLLKIRQFRCDHSMKFKSYGVEPMGFGIKSVTVHECTCEKCGLHLFEHEYELFTTNLFEYIKDKEQ
jgi:hypothetical protein